MRHHYLAARNVKLTDLGSETTEYTSGAWSSAAEARRSHPLDAKRVGDKSHVHSVSNLRHSHAKQLSTDCDEVQNRKSDSETGCSPSQPQTTTKTAFFNTFTWSPVTITRAERFLTRATSTLARIPQVARCPASSNSSDSCSTLLPCSSRQSTIRSTCRSKTRHSKHEFMQRRMLRIANKRERGKRENGSE